jgi:hypothetical protein
MRVFGYLRRRFTLAFGEPITIAATGGTDQRDRSRLPSAARRPASGYRSNEMSDDLEKRPGKALPAWNEGVGEHVRTRLHRSSGNWALGPVKLRTAVGIAPNEENLFLLPDRPLAGENSLK